MKKQMNALKLTFLGVSVVALGVGCASSGYARYDAEQDMDRGIGGPASAEMGSDYDSDYTMVSSDESAAAQATVSTLGRSVDTRADWVNKFPFYDRELRVSETYTFAVPEPGSPVASADSDLPQFSATQPHGSVFVEAAGGTGEVRTGRVIQHSPNPTR
jgi:hypothetical protein